jgi:hypothetical protein
VRRLVVAVLLLAVAGCGAREGGGRPGGADVTDNPLAAFSAAIAATNTSRAAVLTALANADAAVADADSADDDALSGNRTAARPTVARAVSEVHAAAAAAGGTQAAVTSYGSALTVLATAATTAHLDSAQAQAVTAVVHAGHAEQAALRRAANALSTALPTYVAVVGVEQTWYAHANAGWFATAQESGGAYQVARLPYVARLQQAQAALSSAEAGRQTASGLMQSALARARADLATLS